MITTFTYALSAPGAHQPIDSANCVATVVYWNRDGVRGVAYSPSDGPPTLAGVRTRVQCLLAKSAEKWDDCWYMLVLHPSSREEWKRASCHAAGRYGLPTGSADEVKQSAQLDLCAVLDAKVDLRGWLCEPLKHFETWFRTLLFNLCHAAAREIGRQSSFEARHAAGEPVGERLEQIADYRGEQSGSELHEMLSILARYPEPTRSVIPLRAQGFTRNEVAERLGITVEAVRWAEIKHLDDLRRDFASFR